MGNSQSSKCFNQPLSLVSPPIGVVGSQYIAQQTTTLHLRELVSLTDYFKIKDTDGNVIFNCVGHFFSGISNKKTVLDMYNKPVFNIKRKVFSFTDGYVLYQGDDSKKHLGEIHTDITLISSNMRSTFINLEGKKCEIVLKGDFIAHEVYFFRGHPSRGGTLIAKVYRPITGRSVFLERQDYYLEIAPGVDMALMVALCIMIDETFQE